MIPKTLFLFLIPSPATTPSSSCFARTCQQRGPYHEIWKTRRNQARTDPQRACSMSSSTCNSAGSKGRACRRAAHRKKDHLRDGTTKSRRRRIQHDRTIVSLALSPKGCQDLTWWMFSLQAAPTDPNGSLEALGDVIDDPCRDKHTEAEADAHQGQVNGSVCCDRHGPSNSAYPTQSAVSQDGLQYKPGVLNAQKGPKTRNGEQNPLRRNPRGGTSAHK